MILILRVGDLCAADDRESAQQIRNRNSKQPFLRLESVANVQGIASLPVKRLERKVGELPKDVFDEIKRAVVFALEIE